MGFFSWKSAISKKSIPAGYDGIVVILPDNSIKEGLYNGYGCVLDIDTEDEEGEDIFVLYGRFINPEITRDDCFDKEETYNKIMKMIKVVGADEYRLCKPIYEDLETSESCEYQGFFYPEGYKNKLKKRWNYEKWNFSYKKI